VDGTHTADLRADLSRADVGRLYGEAGSLHGFTGSFTVPEGGHDVCVRLQPVSAETLPSTTCRSLVAVHPDRLKEPVGRLEAATVQGRRVAVRGWTFDRDAVTASIDVHVYVNGALRGSYPAHRTRADVASTYPAAGGAHGYDLNLALPGPGTYPVCVFGMNRAGGSRNTLLGCRTVTSPAAVWAPIGALDQAVLRGRTVTLSGWALDGDAPTRSLAVHVDLDGREVRSATADRSRTDVARIHPGTGTTHGYATSLDVPAGSHRVCVSAIDVGPGSVNPRLGCATVTVAAAAWNPVGALDPVVVSGSTVVLRGWTVDPDNRTGAGRVRFSVDGRYAGTVTAGSARRDVALRWPAAGPAHGFSGYLRLGRGRHQVCATAINVGQGSADPSLGCRRVVIP
jgi:hypothetical protein